MGGFYALLLRRVFINIRMTDHVFGKRELYIKRHEIILLYEVFKFNKRFSESRINRDRLLFIFVRGYIIYFHRSFSVYHFYILHLNTQLKIEYMVCIIINHLILMAILGS